MTSRQDSEAASVPDKAILATVLSFLKNKNLKDTEEALRKELSRHGERDIESLGTTLQASAVGQSGAEPEKYEEFYTSQAPFYLASPPSTTTTTAEPAQLANDDLPILPPTTTTPTTPNNQASTQDTNVSSEFTTEEDTKDDDDDDDDDDGDDDVESEMEEEEPLPSEEAATAVTTTDGCITVVSKERLGSLGSPQTFTPSSLLSPLSPPSSANVMSQPPPLWLCSSSSNNSTAASQKKTATTAATIPAVSSFTTPIIHSSLPLAAQSMASGSNSVLFQSTPGTTSLGCTSSVPLAMRAPLMYKLATSPSQSLLAPVLTMLPSTAAAAAAAAAAINMQPMFMATASPIVASTTSTATATATTATSHGGPTLRPSNTLNIQTLMGKKQAELPKTQQQEMIVISTKANEQHVAGMRAEPATGQMHLQADSNTPSPVSSTFSVPSPPHPRTLASIPASELTPQHLELKAFAEDFKTRRIRLGFTQGAVGQSLAERGYNNFAQSTISRFEQMQLSPTNAATIRVILEKWLLEAECPESASTASSSNGSGNPPPMMAGRKRKKRAVFATMTKTALEEFFAINPRPNRQTIESISQKLDLQPEEVRVWFCNKRQKSKSASTSYQSILEHQETVAAVRSNSTSNTSDGPFSPQSIFEGGIPIVAKRHSPSPPTKFTIEELSKSSNTSTISSALQLSSPCTPTGGLVASVTQSKVLPMLFGTTPTASILNNPLLPQFVIPKQIAQTTS